MEKNIKALSINFSWLRKRTFKKLASILILRRKIKVRKYEKHRIHLEKYNKKSVDNPVVCGENQFIFHGKLRIDG